MIVTSRHRNTLHFLHRILYAFCLIVLLCKQDIVHSQTSVSRLVQVTVEFRPSSTPQSMRSALTELSSRRGVQRVQQFSSLFSTDFSQKNSVLLSRTKNSPSVLSALSRLNGYVTIGFADSAAAQEFIQEFRQRNDVASVEINKIHSIETTTNISQNSSSTVSARSTNSLESASDERMSEQWALDKIEAEGAWKVASGKNVIIGVVDTGTDIFHPDLKNQLWINSAEDINRSGKFEPWSSKEVRNGITGDIDGIDQDGNGLIDDVSGWNFVDQMTANAGNWSGRDANILDEQGHGTSVAGVIAAEKENGGICGLAYNARIMTLKAFDATGNAEDDDIAAAIIYGALSGCSVINCSFGDIYFSPIVRDAISAATSLGCFVVASSGNRGGVRRHFPSNYNDVTAIGATTRDDRLAIFSTYGSMVSLVAPGSEILTTANGGGYRFIGGTSFSSPYVAATAALLLEKNPSLSPVEVRAILQETTDDLGEKGWDEIYANGRLNARKAVERVGAGICTIERPADEIEREVGSSTVVIGSAISPIFSSWSLAIGAGESPTAWKFIRENVALQIHNDTLAVLTDSAFSDGINTLRLIMTLTNGRTIERRSRIVSVSGLPRFTAVSGNSCWYNNERAFLVTAALNRPVQLILSIYNSTNTRSRITLAASDRRTQTVWQLITANDIRSLLPDSLSVESLRCEVLAVSSNSDTIRRTINVDFSREAFPQDGFASTSYSLPSGWILDKPINLYNSTTATVVMNTYDASGNFTDLTCYQFAGSNFSKKDSLAGAWIPRGTGDSNGDGIPELFVQSTGKSKLFQQGTGSTSPFSSLIFDKSASEDTWASAMADIDGDGKEELVTRTNSSEIVVWKFRDGRYSVLDTIRNTTQSEAIAGANRLSSLSVAVADFDGDGLQELAFGDDDGDLTVVKFRNGKFEQTFSREFLGGVSSPFIRAVDVDGDGRKELLYAVQSNLDENIVREYDAPVWKCYLFRATSVGSWDIIWQEQFYGVRPLTPFRCGLGSGNINGQTGEEFALFLFPNAYFYTWNGSAIVPTWYYPSAVANTMCVADFNQNGVKDFGFCTGNIVQFFEKTTPSNTLLAPVSIRPLVLNAQEISLSWRSSPFVSKPSGYNVYQGILKDDGETLRFALVRPAVSDSSLRLKVNGSTGTRLYYAITAISGSQESDLSEIISVIPHDSLRVDSVSVITDNVLVVQYSDLYVPSSGLQASAFSLENSTLRQTPLQAIPFSSTSIALIFAAPIPYGENTLRTYSFLDAEYCFTQPSEVVFTNDHVQKPNELMLTKLEVRSAQEFDIIFSNALLPENAVTASHYTLRAGIDTLSAIASLQHIPRQINGILTSSVRCSLAFPLVAGGKEYTISVDTTLRDIAGNRMTSGAGSVLGFTLSSETASNIYAFPNPFRWAESSEITFGNIPSGAELHVQKLSGESLAVLKEKDGAGGIIWNVRQSNGVALESGVYMFSVKLPDGTSSSLKKFVVIR